MSVSLHTRCRRMSRSIERWPITHRIKPFISKDTKIFTLGSCFALEVKRWLVKNNYQIFRQNEYDLIWYNSHTIMSEFQRAAGVWKQSHGDVWKLRSGMWQDPYRRCVYSKTKRQLVKHIRQLDGVISNAIHTADVVIVTLGLTEVFLQKNQRAICACPGYNGGGGQNSKFFASDYTWNVQNMHDMMASLHKINSNACVILTVSPVPLFQTFREMDHLVANTASKSILRAVVDSIVSSYEHVHYFHSYELALNSPQECVYRKDGRHIRPHYINKIMTTFENMFMLS